MKRFVVCVFCLFAVLSALTAEVTSISLSRDHLSSTEPDRAVTVTVTGNGFKTLKSLHVQLSQNGKNQSPVQCTLNAAGTEGYAVINVPVVQNIGTSGITYTIRAIENFTSISPVTATVRITPPASITKLVANDYREGDTSIGIKLYGRNLDIRGETVISIINSEGKEAEECRTILPAPVQEIDEEPEISVKYEIGDLVLQDGTIVSIDDYNKRKMGIPAGVIAYEHEGEAYMVGVASIANANNGNGMRWCSYYAAGYASVSELYADSDSEYVQGAVITGNEDGSSAWSILQTLDPEHTSGQAAAEYYPAFWYAENYGEQNNLYGTKYESGWFIPSLWELAEIYRNRSIINDSFYEFGNYDMGYRRYRSSSQNPYESNYSPGVNFDEGYIWKTYSSKDESDVYVMVVCPVSGNSGKGSNTIEAEIPVPDDTGIFSIQVTVDGVLQPVTSRFQIAGNPEITRVDMPDVSVDYCGEEVPVIIYGKNFTVAGMNPDKFIVFGLEATEVRIMNDTQAMVNITYPDQAGDYEVTFVCDEHIFSDTLHIVDSVTSTWSPGDVILNDGTKIPVADVSRMTTAQISNAVAVVAFTKYGLVPYGMGLVQNESVKMMKEYTTGYSSMISDIICERANSWYADDVVSVTGDTAGYDNWSAIQNLDPNGSQNAAENYPGFWWALNYGMDNNLPAACSDGWFVPTLSELIEVYKNSEIINKTLYALGKQSLMRGWYSTSSQDPNDSDYLWRIDFTDGEIETGYKDSSRYELVIRQFASEDRR